MTTRYVALLRGINVGGRTTVAMADLRQLFVDLGHADARTYIQSGNVVFSSDSSAPALSKQIEARISEQLAMDLTVMVRSSEELAAVAAANPFVDQGADPSKLHVTFLAAAPDKARAESLEVPPGQPDELALGNREVYVHCPNGYGRTKLNNAFVERQLDVAATTRSWKTVLKLLELTEG